MDNTFFCNSFGFRTILIRAFRHTDNSRGIDRSFFAKMKRGTGRILPASGGELRLCAGDVFYLPKGLKYHSYWYPDGNGAVEWDSYGFEFLPIGKDERFVMQKIACDSETEKLLDMIKKGQTATPESVGYLYLFAASVIPDMLRDFEQPTDKTLEKARLYISENFDFKVSELAHHCSMSESSLFALFRERAGMTPVKMKQQLQLECAVSLLGSSELSVEEIANLSGFHSAAYFRKIFKEHLGVSPTEKRRELYLKNRL